MTKICMMKVCAGHSDTECIGPNKCQQWNLCNGIVTVYKPKQAVRKIE